MPLEPATQAIKSWEEYPLIHICLVEFVSDFPFQTLGLAIASLTCPRNSVNSQSIHTKKDCSCTNSPFSLIYTGNISDSTFSSVFSRFQKP